MSYLRVLALAVAALVVFGRSAPTEAQPARVKVVATFSVLGDLVQNVGGDRIELTTLLGPNGDVHTFEPSPSDSAALANAALVVENGVHLETWLDDLYESSRSRAARVAVTEGLDLLPTDEDEHEAAAGADSHGHEEHEHGELDPHTWQDPSSAIHMVGVIRDALVLADPANADVYNANAERYQAELQALDSWALEEVAKLPPERRKLVTTHEAFRYFARHYGFEIVGTVLPATTEAADPSLGEVAELVERIKATGMPTIFAENSSNPRLMQQISSAAGVKVANLFEVLGDPGTAGDTYINMIRSNVSTIVSGLSQ